MLRACRCNLGKKEKEMTNKTKMKGIGSSLVHLNWYYLVSYVGGVFFSFLFLKDKNTFFEYN